MPRTKRPSILAKKRHLVNNLDFEVTANSNATRDHPEKNSQEEDAEKDKEEELLVQAHEIALWQSSFSDRRYEVGHY